MNLFLRYSLEFALVIPMAVFAVLPVIDNVKYDSIHALALTGAFLAAFILTGAYLCVNYFPRIQNVFVPGVLLLFLVYFFCVNAALNQKLFCFFNAAMLSGFCPMYATILMGPVELGNETGPFLITSGLVSLGLAVVVGVIFFRTLTVKLPMLLNEKRISAVWDYMFLIPLVSALFACWITPISPKVVMTGRVRSISLLLYLLMPLMAFVLYQISYFLTAKLTESAKLRQENIFLQMESKRYNELKNYMNESRTMRHNFRQHLLVVSQLAESERIDELKNYLAELSGSARLSYKGFCMNNAVDAVASYYDSIADSQETRITWNLELPSSLPVKESDYCVIMGNLLENALKAVKDLPVTKRAVKINASMLSECMTGLSIENFFAGEIIFAQNGLPISQLEGHGVGLASVSNIVERYGGSMSIKAGNNVFSVGIILYS
ncbi:MAG: GHKL domain-containing protein [Synergistaceae bacterium]|nr:GHKL domain-containing protein [Synergistaceae bacterium]